MRRKSQSASNAAAFIAILTVLIILYILFLPPDVRDTLLNGGGTGGTGGSDGGSGAVISTLFQQSVGRVTYINTNEKIIDIPSVRIYSPTSAQVIKSLPNIYIKNALFDKEKSMYSMDFEVDTAATKNVMLSFTVKSGQGLLTIKLNDKEISSAEITTANPTPIRLDGLNGRNTITFTVSDPGWAFWRTNEYALEGIQVTGDVTDFKNSEAVQYFTLSESQKTNLDSVKLYFFPTCNFKDVGSLEVQLNRKVIFDSVGDCGTRSFAVLDNKLLIAGSNELRFSTSKGSYLLDNVNVKITLTKQLYNTYFFDVKDDYFETKLMRSRCGDYDGTCPAGCSDTNDADCCFKHNGYWCAYPTDNSYDRCVFYVDSSDCGICKTGYYDSSGDTHPNCENKCGDNNDDRCASGCNSPNKYYDKDCCFASNKYNFWCKEMPVTGITDKCKASVSYDDCKLCPSGYFNTDGAAPDACSSVDNTDLSDKDFALLSDYDVKLSVRFADSNTRKRVDININGHKVSIDTTNLEYTRIIDDYIQRGSNAIEIVPLQDIDIAEIRVDLKRLR